MLICRQGQFDYHFTVADTKMPASNYWPVFQLESSSLVYQGFERGEGSVELGASKMRKRQVVVRRTEEPSRSSTTSFTIRNVKYGECLKNHAVSVGGYAVDGAESSWLVARKAQLVHSLVPLVVAIETSTGGKWRQRWYVIVLHLLQMVIRISKSAGVLCLVYDFYFSCLDL
ncbi:hypothetical protein NC653_011399 [Populus alba x Populus x berolinensis]|uniref:ZF-HD dimerization-type domain-containing protein n=1 Tax=Populus alba x Populus x berolinensis TaxID=444605 RepID=A0AAD6R279_9ROSI|nr:hypothetical protein NC653_011399 [Populus alba x Populus x berolinensis]